MGKCFFRKNAKNSKKTLNGRDSKYCLVTGLQLSFSHIINYQTAISRGPRAVSLHREGQRGGRGSVFLRANGSSTPLNPHRTASPPPSPHPCPRAPGLNSQSGTQNEGKCPLPPYGNYQNTAYSGPEDPRCPLQ